MKRIFRKWKSKRGESFVEILIAILVVAFGSVLIATLYASSMDLNVEASEQDQSYYEAMSEMEQMFGSSEHIEANRRHAVIEDEDKHSIETDVYSYGNDKNAAYKRLG